MVTKRAFIQRWKKEFDKHLNEHNRAIPELTVWEGQLVCQELARTKLLNTVALRKVSERRWWRQQVMVLIAHEIRTYFRYANELVRTNRELADDRRFLLATVERFLKQKQRCFRPETKDVLDRCVNNLKYGIRRLNTAQKEKWEFPRGYFGEILREPKYRRYPVREMDIDARFQIRAGKILRFFLRKKYGVSLQTISRLVVLVYIAADLARINADDHLIVNLTGKKLTVGKVAQRLTRAGLEAATSTDALDIAGSFRLTTRGPHGKVVQLMTIKQDGERIHGTLENKGPDENFEGKVKGDSIIFQVKRDLPKKRRTILEYTGVIKSYSIEGTMKTSELQSQNIPWSAVPLGPPRD